MSFFSRNARKLRQLCNLGSPSPASTGSGTGIELPLYETQGTRNERGPNAPSPTGPEQFEPQPPPIYSSQAFARIPTRHSLPPVQTPWDARDALRPNPGRQHQGRTVKIATSIRILRTLRALIITLAFMLQLARLHYYSMPQLLALYGTNRHLAAEAALFAGYIWIGLVGETASLSIQVTASHGVEGGTTEGVAEKYANQINVVEALTESTKMVVLNLMFLLWWLGD